MSTIQNVTIVGIEAGADLSADANQFKFVKLVSGKVQLCGAGENGIGILMNKPALGQQAEVAIAGIAKVQADAAFAVDAKLMSTADGQAATATATNHYVAQALQAATAAGQIVKVLLKTNPVLA